MPMFKYATYEHATYDLIYILYQFSKHISWFNKLTKLINHSSVLPLAFALIKLSAYYIDKM